MAEERINIHIPSRPAVLDSVRLQNIQLSLPIAPDPWHRPGKPQPATASLKLSYSSAIAAAAADDVSLSIDYGKLYKRLDQEIRDVGQKDVTSGAAVQKYGRMMVNLQGNQQEEMLANGLGQDVRLIAGVVTSCGLGLLDETAAGIRRMSHLHQASRQDGGGTVAAGLSAQTGTQALAAGATKFPINGEYGQCEVWLHLPKALLRAEGGLKYRSLTTWGYKRADASTDANDAASFAAGDGRRSVVLEEEFRIENIRCHCILGVNSHERVEKQAVIITLEFKGPGQLAWGSTVVDTYQEMTRTVAEVSPCPFFSHYCTQSAIGADPSLRKWKRLHFKQSRRWQLSWHGS